MQTITQEIKQYAKEVLPVGFLFAIIVIVLACLIPPPAFADVCGVVVGSHNDYTASGGSQLNASKFVATEDCDVTEASVEMAKVGSPSAPLQVWIYSDTGSVPNAVILTGGTVTTSSVFPVFATASTTFAASATYLHSGVTYYLVVDGNASGVNTWAFGLHNTGSTWFANSGSGWSAGGEDMFSQVDGTLHGGGGGGGGGATTTPNYFDSTACGVSSTTPCYMVGYRDWLFVNLIIIFLLSLQTWAFWFRNFRHDRGIGRGLIS